LTDFQNNKVVFAVAVVVVVVAIVAVVVVLAADTVNVVGSGADALFAFVAAAVTF
jgi:hypothetical protein